MVIDEFLQALGLDNLSTDFQSLSLSTTQSSTAMLEVASLCAGLSDALNQAQQSVRIFGTETVALAMLMQQAAESGVPPLLSEPVQAVLAQPQSAAIPAAASKTKPAETSLFISASAAFGDLDEQSSRLAKSWQQFLQDQDVEVFAQSLGDIGSAVAGDADQLTGAQQEVVDFFNSIKDGIGFFIDLKTAMKGIGEAMKVAAPVMALLELPLTAIAAAVVTVGAALVYLYQQYEAFKKGATDGLLYDMFTEFGELLVRVGSLWRYVMDEGTEGMLKAKSALSRFGGKDLTTEEQARLTQLEQQTSKGLTGYQDATVRDYQIQRHKTQAHAGEQKNAPTPQSAPALSTLIQQPKAALPALPVHGPLTHRFPAAAATDISGTGQTGGTQFYIDTVNVTADSPAEFASSVSQEAEVVHSRHISTMLNYSRGKGVRP